MSKDSRKTFAFLWNARPSTRDVITTTNECQFFFFCLFHENSDGRDSSKSNIRISSRRRPYERDVLGPLDFSRKPRPDRSVRVRGPVKKTSDTPPPPLRVSARKEKLFEKTAKRRNRFFFTFFRVDVVKGQKRDGLRGPAALAAAGDGDGAGLALALALALVAVVAVAVAVAGARGRRAGLAAAGGDAVLQGGHPVVGARQVHHAGRARVHLADGQALEVRPVSGREARPRGLDHGQLEVEQVHHGARASRGQRARGDGQAKRRRADDGDDCADGEAAA